ncbi:outer membrane-specific lipoprotein transporter subunit; ATP-binding component of ABC superfamily [Candidatus Nitrosotalea okcheonensis]|uniref:Outer membrane-specific lipoprotein transporter subunit ATP-binding component of ABC superfamily n=2 Tax=Candidatus Nitrosotalea okcheonensis TaxID=1903276 RepID=A0A2H1FBX6_9ARCH|nr:outer membrane-specific lipoprotein transporter subunit; ATP-binding component of ABC superfamily [Candidatus Nitrosotalea okcheonensis]
MILKNMTKDLVVEKSTQNEVVNNNSFALRVENLSKIYDSSAGRVVALDNVSFAIKKGEFVSVVGPSGSGKSTVLNMVGALDRPTSGKIYIDGIDVFSLNDSEIATMRNGRIGFIFQSFNLINRTTVHKNVRLPGMIAGMSNDDVNSRTMKILEALGIADKRDQKPVNLSGGQQQRVAIARSLINNPTIILADEPTGNLDTKTGDDVFDMLKMLSHKFKRTIVMVTHNPELAESTDRSILLRDGRIEKNVIN